MTPPSEGPYDGWPMNDSKLSPAFRVLLWDFSRGTLAYDLALLVLMLLLLLVPGERWGDPLWR